MKAPIGNLKLEYHKIVNRCQSELRLLVDEARETKNQVLAPYRKRQQNLQKYEEALMSDAQPQFDVFLCHKSEDKEAVIKIAEQLKYEHKIEPWLDDWELRPGFPWQPELEKQIAHIKSAAVFVGKSGIGPWQSREIYGFLSEFQERQCPVIPVLLPDAPQQPQLPIFLKGMTWVDFREQTRVYTPAMDKLIWGITGIKPKTRVKVIPQNQTQNTGQNKTDDSGDDLKSEKGVDYTKLRDLLAAGKWKEADYETYLVMLQAVGREKGDWIREQELLNFPCTDLRTIDQLWVKYSNGRFGFSVQKEIYLSVGGKPDGKYYEEAWKKLGDRVGWRVKENWISYDEVIFDITTARFGHLPHSRHLEHSRDTSSILSALFFTPPATHSPASDEVYRIISLLSHRDL